jgi:uncharacterized protein
MISVADLINNNRVPGNYYATEAYVRGDLEMGILESRRGDRLVALPSTLIEGIYAGLQQETGQAARLVLFNCGRWWGKNFYTRFQEELREYYGTALGSMPMLEFIHCLQQCWTTYGWGNIDLDPQYADRGLLVIKTWNSPFAKIAPRTEMPVCHLESGVLCSFFSQLSGREQLNCLQISCESLGAEQNLFVVGLAKRLKAAEPMVQSQMNAEAILQKLAEPPAN